MKIQQILFAEDVMKNEIDFFKNNASDKDILNGLDAYSTEICELSKDMLIERNKAELYLHILKTRDDFDTIDILSRFVGVASTKDFAVVFKNKNYKDIIKDILQEDEFNKIENSVKNYKKENKKINKENKNRQKYNRDMMLILHLCQQYPLEIEKVLLKLKENVDPSEIFIKEEQKLVFK